MRLLATRMNVEYDRSFRQPIFKVSRCAAEILECFYNALSSQYPLAMSDLSAMPGTTMGDIAIRVALFSGHGLLEVRPEKFTARFDGLQSKADVDIVRSVIRLSEEALDHGLPEADYRATAIKTSAWLACEGGEKSVQTVLDKYGAIRSDVLPKRFGAEYINNSLRGRLSNVSEGWVVNFTMELSEISEFHLFSMFNGAYSEDGKYTDFDERVRHFEKLYSDLLAYYGFERNLDEQDA